jgi:AcrR family transcriptional regulator
MPGGGSRIPRRAASPRGRRRAFEVTRALDVALRVFWRKGYEGASLDDLTSAMGINRPSLYAAFGNKESLFRQAMDRYAEGPAAFVQEALDGPTARAAVERLLFGAAAALTGPRNPPGCLAVHGALAAGETAQGIRKELVARRAVYQTDLRRRFERARREGDLPAAVNCADLARFVAVVHHGMAVQAAGGASRAELRRVARMALRAWPG